MSSISLPGLGEDVEESLLQLIEEYFYDGLTYDEMCLFLNRRHGLNVTVHQLKARLKILGLKRRGANVSVRERESAIRVRPFNYYSICCNVILFDNKGRKRISWKILAIE